MPLPTKIPKEKQTLYNFVSFRSPQVTKNWERIFRFVEPPPGRFKKTLKLSDTHDRAIDDLKRFLNHDEFFEMALFFAENRFLLKHADVVQKLQKVKEKRNGLIKVSKSNKINFRNIGDVQAKTLFNFFINEVNEGSNFRLKQLLSELIVFWNLVAKFNDISATVNEQFPELLKEGEKEKRDLLDKLTRDLLAATIVAGTKDPNDLDAIEALKIEGPMNSRNSLNHSNADNYFLPSNELVRIHELNLSKLQLEEPVKFNVSEEKKTLLIERLIANSSTVRPVFFFAGGFIRASSGTSSLGIIATVFGGSDTSYLFLTLSDELENGRIPYKVSVRIKKASQGNGLIDREDEDLFVRNPSVVKGKWYVELPKIDNLSPDVGNLFLELSFAGGATFTAVLQMNKLTDAGIECLRGSAKLRKGNGIPFKSEFFRESGVWNLRVSGIQSIVTANNKPRYVSLTFRSSFDLQSQRVEENGIRIAGSSVELLFKDFDKERLGIREFEVLIVLHFDNGGIYYSLPYKIIWDNDRPAAGESYFMLDSGTDAYGKSFVPKSFGVTKLGIADYQRVVSHVVRYEAAEVAHIENLMLGEYKEKVVTKERITEITEFESLETEMEQLNDSTSTERFQMQTAIANIRKEDNKTNFDAHASYSGGTTSLQINYGNATNSSREESNNQAVTTAKELTLRAMERIVSKTKNERTVKVTDKLTDVSKHGFDNRGGSSHVSGVYRYINAVYKNEIQSYDNRLAFEFAIPQPSRMHRLGLENSELETVEKLDPPPPDPRKDFSSDFLSESNYLGLAQTYEVDLTPYPDAQKSTSIAFQKSDFSGSDEYRTKVQTESGYVFDSVKIMGLCRVPTDRDGSAAFNFAFGTSTPFAKPIPRSGGYPNTLEYGSIPLHDDDRTELLQIQCNIVNIASVTFSLSLKSTPTDKVIRDWQAKVYKQICDAYKERLKEYHDRLVDLKARAVERFETNPLNFRQIEQTILRMNCISYLIAGYEDTTVPNRNFGKDFYTHPAQDNETFSNTRVNNSQELDEYSAFAKFLEQAFEWNIMSYNFYPFYWGSYDDWDELYQCDYNDPLFKNFMQAGMARVVVTVRPNFENAVMLYMETGKIWEGGRVPVYKDDLYVSIANELKDPEYAIEKPWYTVLPTNLIALQENGVLVDTTGLPNFEKPDLSEDDEFQVPKGNLVPIINVDEKTVDVKKD